MYIAAKKTRLCSEFSHDKSIGRKCKDVTMIYLRHNCSSWSTGRGHIVLLNTDWVTPSGQNILSLLDNLNNLSALLMFGMSHLGMLWVLPFYCLDTLNLK